MIVVECYFDKILFNEIFKRKIIHDAWKNEGIEAYKGK